jgi:hypothetical protein
LVGGIGIMNIMLVTVTSARAKSVSKSHRRAAQRHHHAVPRGVERPVRAGGVIGILFGSPRR